MTAPTTPAFDEGREAAEQGKTFYECPYFFGKVGVTQEVFDREYRAKMNDWYRGWKENTEWRPSRRGRRKP